MVKILPQRTAIAHCPFCYLRECQIAHSRKQGKVIKGGFLFVYLNVQLFSDPCQTYSQGYLFLATRVYFQVADILHSLSQYSVRSLWFNMVVKNKCKCKSKALSYNVLRYTGHASVTVNNRFNVLSLTYAHWNIPRHFYQQGKTPQLSLTTFAYTIHSLT